MEYGTHLSVTTVHPGYVDTAIHDRSRAAGVSLDGLVPAERIRYTVMTVVAAAAPRPARDVASTTLGLDPEQARRAARRNPHWRASKTWFARQAVETFTAAGMLSGPARWIWRVAGLLQPSHA
jgi:NAD(P)-dependent dehydrogenase (short-subunit alcohol dehydrogenase family)